MDALNKAYAPYTGAEPYLYLCFSEASGKRAAVLLRRLAERGVRVWYCTQVGTDRVVRESMHERMLNAALTVVYLDDNFRSDPIAKSRLLACQRSGQKIVCLNTDGGDGGLSIGLHADAVEVRLSRGASAADAERALLHADGFSQALIGEPAQTGGRLFHRLTGILIGVTVALLAAGALWFFLHRVPPAPPPVEQDTVTFADETIREAVRGALGGGPIDADRLGDVTVLRLPGDAIPADLSDLTLLPSLNTIELSQTAASGVSAHPELYAYTIELYGGASE